MAGAELRRLAMAGALSSTLIFGGVFGGIAAVAPAWAQPGDTGGSSQDPGTTGGGSTDGSGAGSETGTGDSGDTGSTPNETSEPDEPAAPSDDAVIEDVDPVEPEVVPEPDPEPEEVVTPPTTRGRSSAVPEPTPPARTIPNSQIYSHSITLPWIRLPSPGEIPPGTWPSVSNFYTTWTIPVPTLGEYLRALRIMRNPAPAPGPTFRTQEDGPPVADAFSGTTTGGDGGGGPVVTEPVVLRAPLVTVPRATTVAGRPTHLPARVPADPAVAPAFAPPGMAGVRTPAIRGSVAPTPGTTAPLQATPAGVGPSPRVGTLARGVTNPTVGEIAAVALPGVAGLLFLTVSGGMIGYRQANSARYVRTAGAERFLA
ncbi:hypothetical protein MPRF_16610 [Mycolicibacterium parafortuitum]|uniref:Uncharacterized protein n=1 Tax=Mycolicibacterium parafortuitum TaxID=39692 RepID=A0A7I7U024_MYCPF|nr:hypothetical protein [Mycolicibacterium parafortuitum]BBY74762.1 hypothetical protein MPRF_16610 [Mycolicibacterium parafortuitum]